MTECGYCSGIGIEPNIGGLCVRCHGSGTRKRGRDPEAIVTRTQTIHCFCGFAVEGGILDCPAGRGQPCPPRSTP